MHRPKPNPKNHPHPGNATPPRPRAAMGLAILGFAAAMVQGTARAEEAAITFEQHIHPLIENFCVDCHNPDKLNGDLNLERFQSTNTVLDALAVWERIAMRIKNREMPPRNRPQPTDEEKLMIQEWIASLELDNTDCDRIASEETVNWYPGFVMSRRLNRAEYENTIRDLFGAPIHVARFFPADGAGGEGFDNNGSALFLSAIQIEKYLEAADYAVETALPPLKHGQNAPAHQRELIIPQPGIFLDARAAARIVLNRFTERAWRRPVNEAELGRLLEMFDRAHNRGDTYTESLKFAFKAVLVSPHFLFLVEPEPAQPGVYELGDFPLASRLSYFLWATMPDGELFELARQGRLQNTREIERQVQRMLRHPNARALGDIFAAQWLGITQLGETILPDPERFPEFDFQLAQDMRGEAALVFTHIVAEDRSLLELIDAPYTAANERLAALYGIEGVTGGELRIVPVSDRNRGGVLGMAAVLATTSQPLRTSPVLRGKWVLEQLLGDRVPPPPPDAGELPEDDVQPDGLSLRARLEAHRKNPDCASCHERMDPIGFGLENFDPIGRWRDEQAGMPVDSAGELPSGETFSGPRELKEILLARKNQFARNLARKTLGYALGRSLTRFDQCVIDAAVEAMQHSDYRPSALFTEIALSYPFRHRYSGSGS